MYISKIKIEGFRNFPNNEITFNDGVNVIIGHNNAGKTSLLKAIGILINTEISKRLELDDFCKTTTLAELQSHPPSVTITLTISQSKDEDLNSDDLVTVSNWLTKLEEPYEAVLTYKFYLPAEKLGEYQSSLAHATDKDQAWLAIKHEFLRFFINRIFGGDAALQTTADSESLQKFDFQFLNAIRDVERDMFTGRNTMLREVLDFFMDYEIKSADEAVKSVVIKQQEIKVKKVAFATMTATLINELQQRMQAGKEQILSYANKTGATFNNAKPDFDGALSEVDMYSAFRLIIGYTAFDMKIPATHNGLGYNNLIFMSLLLAKMQVNSDGNYLGSNAKVFPVLAIEEPEAHLHPSMQYKFLKFLKEIKDQKKVRQIFVTTHSTQITSAVSLDEIICLHNESGVISVGYPGKTFPDTTEGKKAKAYVQRFLDATRSDMLFAQKVIFVEGLAEQLLLPTLAKYCSKNLEDYHTAIIPVGGRFFDYFLYMFDTTNVNAIPKTVACLKDRDPERKKKTGGSYSSCYPFEMGQDAATYDYKDHISLKTSHYAAHSNIRFFGQNHDKGKTFEYELCLDNSNTGILMTDSLSNREELLKLLELYKNKKPLSDMLAELRKSDANLIFETSIKVAAGVVWTEEEKGKAIIASRYLASVGKGENALELANKLEANLLLRMPAAVITTTPEAGVTEPAAIPAGLVRVDFNVPSYVKDSIDWICQ